MLCRSKILGAWNLFTKQGKDEEASLLFAEEYKRRWI